MKSHEGLVRPPPPAPLPGPAASGCAVALPARRRSSIVTDFPPPLTAPLPQLFGVSSRVKRVTAQRRGPPAASVKRFKRETGGVGRG